MKKLTQPIIWGIVCAACSVACLSSCSGEPPKPMGKVYATGSVFTTDTQTSACYWVDGQIVLLDEQSNAKAIAQSGNDLYIVGTKRVVESNTAKYYAGYWKNGTFVELGQVLGTTSIVEDVETIGGKVYACGYIGTTAYLWNLTDNTNTQLKVNGDNTSFQTLKFTANGSAPIVAGTLITRENGSITQSQACWWDLDGDIHVVGEAGKKSHGTGAMLNGASHVVYGYQWDDSGKFRNSRWIDGAHEYLDENVSTMINEVCVSGSDVYRVGMSDGKPCYWKNDEIHLLPEDPIAGVTNLIYSALHISIDGTDVYVGGQYMGDKDDASVSKPMYWKNDSIIPIEGTRRKSISDIRVF